MSTCEVTICSVTDKSREDFEHLHNCIFPVAYSRKFYKDILSTTTDHTGGMAFLPGDQRPIGVYSTRVEKRNEKKCLYIMSLGCKIAHRRKGVGSILLIEALKRANVMGCDLVFLHVQDGNRAAMSFYEKHGFVVKETVENYYKRLHPPNAMVLERDLTLSTATNGI